MNQYIIFAATAILLTAVVVIGATATTVFAHQSNGQQLTLKEKIVKDVWSHLCTIKVFSGNSHCSTSSGNGGNNGNGGSGGTGGPGGSLGP